MNIVFLDDDAERTKVFRSAVPSASFATHAEQVIEIIKNTPVIDQLYLDHDLGGQTYVDSAEKNTGMEVVRWIVANKPTIHRIICHSLNEPARRAMARTLAENGYSVKMIPWIKLNGILKGGW